MNYIKGMIFTVLYLLLMYMIGTVIQKDRSAPAKLIIGYVAHAALVGIVGIPVQVFQINWHFYFYYLILLDICLYAFSIYYIKKNHIQLFEDGFIKKYWFVIFVAVIAQAMVSFYNIELWYNNQSDDSYYLVRMAAYPYLKYEYHTNVVTGLHTKFNMFDLRNFTTFELEASVYIYLFKVFPTLFARGFMSFINYFLFSCSIYILAEKVIEMGKIKLNKNLLQYVCLALIVVDFDTAMLAIRGVIDIRDGWMINHAMYYGAALVRAVSFIWLLVPLLNIKKITIKEVIITAITSFVLMTKSTVALPLIVVSAIVYLIYYTYQKDKRLLLGLLVTLILVSLAVGNHGTNVTNKYLSDTGFYDHLLDNLKSIVIIPFSVIIVVMGILKKERYLKFSLIILSMILLFALEPINNLIELSSVYAFVRQRSVSALTMLIVIYALIILLVEILSIIKNRYTIVIINMILVLLITFSSVCYLERGYQNAKNDLITFKENHYYIPEFIIRLSSALDELQKKEKKELIVNIPNYVYTNKTSHKTWFNENQYIPSIMLAGSVRMLNPTLKVPNLIWKSSNTNDRKFVGYSSKAYEDFLYSPSDKNELELKKYLAKYPINCIVMWNENSRVKMKKLGFNYYTTIGGSKYAELYIYYK